MNGYGIHKGADLRAQSLDFLQRNFGKSGAYYYWISRGIDERPVRADRIRKSRGAENTFVADLIALGEAREALKPIIDKVWRHCEATGTRGRTVTLKVKYANFHQITRSATVAEGCLELRCLRSAVTPPKEMSNCGYRCEVRCRVVRHDREGAWTNPNWLRERRET